MPTWLNWKSIKGFILPSFYLAFAFFLAVMSSVARGSGQQHAAAFLAVLSLALALLVGLTLVPRLLVRVKFDLFSHLQYFRFTRRGAFFILLVMVIGFSTLNTGNNLLILVLSVLLASLIVSGMVSNLVLQRLKIVLTIPDAIYAGHRAVFQLSLLNLKRVFPSFALKLKGREGGSQLEGTDFFVQERIFPYIRAKEKQSAKIICEFARRGLYSVDGFEVTTTFPFGFFWRGRTLPAEGKICVYPQLCDVDLLFRHYPQLRGWQERNIKGHGSMLYNIREYQTGDDARFVHWKSTAKLGRIMVKDFSSEEQVPVHILFWTHLRSAEDKSREQFEKAVSVIGSLARHYQEQRLQFTFESGEFQVKVNGHRSEYELLMEFLACVQPSPETRPTLPSLDGPAILFSPDETPGRERLTVVNYMHL